MKGALERAHLVRSIAEVLSSDVPLADLWPRACSLFAALAGAERVTVALRESGGDRIAFVFSADAAELPDSPVRAGSLAGDVLAAGETIVRGDGERLALGLPIHFGRSLFGAICLDRIAAYEAEDVTLLESCALYAGARLYHESAVQNSERYERLAFTDALTGIANRRSFDETFAREWARALRDRTQIAVLMVDLDYFKSYNDGYGHQAGDECLQLVAQALATSVKRPADVIARYGGEEFVALLPETDLEGAIALAEELREAVARLRLAHKGCSLGRISISAGASTAVPAQADGAAHLLHAADDALYRAKLGGRNRVYASGYESQSQSTRPRRIGNRSNLPVSLTRLIGRRTEIECVRSLLGDHRLVSIVGTGGTGKTRTAVAVAAEMSDRFEDGAWFVDLSPISDPALVASTIAAQFGTQVTMDDEGPEALANALAGKSALVVLDNCEHLLGGVIRLTGALLRSCPHLCVLATSREPLGIPGEAVYRLPLLSLPPPSVAPAAAEALAYDAVALFVERATAANRTFVLTDDDVDTVVRICRDLDGIALAIELAASRIGTIGLDALALRLHNARLLDGGDRSGVPRQQAMHATIDWSYNLLSDDERALFRRLSIFAGGFTFESATEVCSTPPVHANAIFELLSSLIRKSMVVEETGADGRYRLLEPLRAFARERLIEAGETQSTARRHAEFYDEFGRRADARFLTTPSRLWIAGIEPEIDNLRAAIAWALDDRGDLLLGASIVASTLAFFNDVVSDYGVRTMHKALESLPPGVAPAIEARLCVGLVTSSRMHPAEFLRMAGDRAVELYRGLRDRAGLARALRGAASIVGWYYRDERELADAMARESIEIARELGDPMELAISLRTRGLTIDISDFPAKRAVLEESLSLIRRHGNDVQIGTMLTWISELEFSAGEWHRAFEYGREAVRFAESAGSNQLYVQTTCNFATYAAALGDCTEARNAIAHALAGCRKTRQQEGFSFAVQAAAVVAAGTGRVDDAARLIGWVDARVGVVHPPRQADQSEDICYRKLMVDLGALLPAHRLAELRDEGSTLTEDAAIALALTV